MDTLLSFNDFLGPNTAQYLQAIALVIVGLLVLGIVNALLKRRIRTLEERHTLPDHRETGRTLPVWRFFQRIAVPLLFLGILSIAVNIVEFDERIQRTVQILFSIIMTIIIVRSVNKGIELSFAKYFEKEWSNHDHEKNLKPLISLLKFLLWIVGLLFLLANLGLDISTALAGLGVGGIAVAIAAQGILGDLFSYFVIFFDKPFEIGDFVIFVDNAGVV